MNPTQTIINAFQDSGKQVLVILGPTASGKTGVSIEVAKKIDGEIISADSRQIYKGMDVGTGKVTKEEMQGIPHYMIDICAPDETFTVADYKEQVEAIIEDILQRGKVPIIAGGTGLYLNALMQNYELPPAPHDETLRAQIEKELEEKGEDALWNELYKVDQEEALKLDRKNHRYLVRATEIYRSTGKKKSEMAMKKDPKFYYFPVGLRWDVEILNMRINKRHRMMFENDAIIEETKALLAKGYTFAMESMTSIGYKQVGEFLEGKLNREDMIMYTLKAARHYAKRQRTWFRRLEKMVPIFWVDL